MNAAPKMLFSALRPHHWVKNLFIFLPLIFGGQLVDLSADLRVLYAFFLFSLITSAGYLMNDVMDRAQDAYHPLKSLRPVSAGKISRGMALGAACFLAVLSSVLSFTLDVYFGFLSLFYLAFNLAYSKALKKIVIIDVFCLGVFFLLRIGAGSAVTGVKLSHWIIIMTVLLALFLGFVKRRQELKLLGREAVLHRGVLARYNIKFIDQMMAVITSSIVVVYMLYTVDERTVREFGTNHLLLGVPFVYYGIFRYLYLVYTRDKGDTPVMILLSDRALQIALAAWIFVCVLVIYGMI